MVAIEGPLLGRWLTQRAMYVPAWHGEGVLGVGSIPWRACSVRCSNSRNALTWDLRKGVALPMTLQMGSAWELCSSGLIAVLTSSVLRVVIVALFWVSDGNTLAGTDLW